MLVGRPTPSRIVVGRATRRDLSARGGTERAAASRRRYG